MTKRSHLRSYSLFVLLAVAIVVASVGQAVSETKGGLNVTLAMSPPTNGSFYVVGEKASVAVTLRDASGKSLTKGDMNTLGLYMYGPQDPLKTVTTVKLLKASTDRSKRPHHFIDLLADKRA